MSNKEKHTTTEICTPLSHGIWDHIFKFSPMPLSFALYCHMLCFAKKQGKDKGVYRFSMKELIRLFTFGNKPRGSREEEGISRRTLRRAIRHLDDIDFIEIVHTPKGKVDNTWVVRVKKYKGGMDSFLTVLQVEKSEDDGVVGFNPMTEQQVMQFDQDHDMDMVEDSSDPKEGQHHSKVYNFDRWIPHLDLTIIASVMKVLSSCAKEIYRWSPKVMQLLEASEREAAQVLAKDFREFRYHLKSSHEILPPDHAIRVTDILTRIIEDKNTKQSTYRAAREARYEFIRYYWNNMRWGDDNKFAFHRTTSPPDAARQDKLKRRFEDSFFKENWAFAVCMMRKSAYCRGEKSGWRASLHEGSYAFLQSDEAVRRGLDGGRFVENDKERQGGRKGGVARSFESSDYEGQGSSIFDDTDD
jgi:hypothetical protein